VTRKPQKLRKKRAVLGAPDIRKIRAAAKAHSPLAHALVEFLYTNGSRASEPGCARVTDVDLHNGTVMLTHLKGGLEPEPQPLANACREALRTWLPQRTFVEAAQQDYVFPSARPGDCYPCAGKGALMVKKRKRGGASEGKITPCPHCHASGTRWGMTRHEVRHLVVEVFTKAGIPSEFHFPHILRHSAVTQMLNSGTPAPAIQERVGHAALATTFGYMHTTDEARAKVNRAFDEDPE
jgi:site-specific recombinase XerD